MMVDLDIITISEEVSMTRVYGEIDSETEDDTLISAEDIVVTDGVDVSYGPGHFNNNTSK